MNDNNGDQLDKFMKCRKILNIYFWHLRKKTSVSLLIFLIFWYSDILIFIHNWRTFTFEVLYLHQTFISDVSDEFTHIKIFQYARCNFKLWSITWLFVNFNTLLTTIHVWRVGYSPNFHWLCLINTHNLVCRCDSRLEAYNISLVWFETTW